MNKVEQNTLGKVATALTVATFVLSSALNALKKYAPKQTQLITVLDYVNAVITAIVYHQELPEVPALLIGDDGKKSPGVASFAMTTDGDSAAIELKEEYREVTAAFDSGEMLDLSEPIAVVRTV